MKTIEWSNLLVIAFVVGLTATACCKKSDPKPNEPSVNVKQSLIAKKWLVVSEKPDTRIDINGDGISDEEFRQFADECQLDDYSIYTEDGFAMDYDGTKRCTETPSVKYRWELIENNSRIKISKANDTYQMKIISINDNMLVVSQPYVVSGITINVTTTYKKI